MAPIQDMARGPRRSPVGRAIAKVTPGGMEVTPGAAEAGTRIGDLLHAPTAEALGPDVTPKQILNVAGRLERRAANVANTLTAEADAPFRALGKTKTIDIGTSTPNMVEYYPGIKPSEFETAHGIPGAAAVPPALTVMIESR